MTDQNRYYGFSCYNCHASFDRPISNLPSAPLDRLFAAEFLAGKEGWGMGHWDGDAHYVCGDCHHAVWDFIRFDPVATLHRCSRELRQWLFRHSVVFPARWTGRSRFAWPPSTTLYFTYGRVLHWLLKTFVPWTRADAIAPPPGLLIRARFADGSIHNSVFWTDGPLRKDLPEGWFSGDTHSPIGDESPMAEWRYA